MNGFLATSLLLAMLASIATAQNLTICGTGSKVKYSYALCAASTCTSTGGIIATNNGSSYPEVVCTCPVIKGMAIAQPSAGNMKGSCDPPIVNGKQGVWSLFAPLIFYPQEASGFVQSPKNATKAVVQKCPGSLAALSANCFSFSCSLGAVINGTQTAQCKCPIAQIPNGTTFLIEAGQGNPAACAMSPVAAPDPFSTLFSQYYTLRGALSQITG